MCLTDLGEACKFDLFDVEDALDEFNSLTWLQRHTTLSKVTFKNAYELISENLYNHKLSEFEDFYLKNSDQTTDSFAA